LHDAVHATNLSAGELIGCLGKVDNRHLWFERGASTIVREGLVDADLGRHVLKKRLPLAGRGKRGGARTIVASNRGSRWYFLYGFAKNQRAGIDTNELHALQQLAHDLLSLDDAAIAAALKAEEIAEVDHEQQDPS
jgi:hypothetical protein